ncbi:hypothetical protein YC2023_010855 [Brassica napus]
MGEPKFTVVFGYSLPLSEIQILLIFIFIITSHMFFRFIGISQIASHFMVSTHLMERERHAGLILGPQLFDLLEKLSEKLLLDPALDGSAALRGVRRSATHRDRDLDLRRATVRRFMFQEPLHGQCGPSLHATKEVLAKRTVMISSQSSILLPMVTFILLELKILNSELGRLVLSASMIIDILGIIVS